MFIQRCPGTSMTVWVCGYQFISQLCLWHVWSRECVCIYTGGSSSGRSCVFPQLGLRVVWHIWWYDNDDIWVMFCVFSWPCLWYGGLRPCNCLTSGLWWKAPCFDVGNPVFSRLCSCISWSLVCLSHIQDPYRFRLLVISLWPWLVVLSFIIYDIFFVNFNVIT